MRKRKQVTDKFNFAEAFGANYKDVQNILYKNSQIHINNNENLTIENCNAIVLYTENEICFDMGKRQVSIKGDNMIMETLAKNTITVKGRFFSIEFIYGKARY
ncbi:MAG: YabP/YqfC family sporulation protein [Oscillospiraceae bacterium]